MDADGQWSEMLEQYCKAVAEVRLAWQAIALKFDATANGTMTNAPTAEEERRIAQARVRLREIEAAMRVFTKSRAENITVPVLPSNAN